jgi:hypothetical protein
MGTNNDISLSKYNALGVQQWEVFYNNGGNDTPVKVEIGESSNVYVTGNSQVGSVNKALVANIEAYKASYCDYPGVKHQQYGYIEFLNRNFTSFISMTAKPSENTWKINDFRFSAQQQAVIDQMKNDDSKCQSKPDLAVKEKVKYQIGDKVTVQFSNGARPCIIDKTDPNMDTRYSVKIEGDTSGKAYWIDDTFISKR